MVYEAAGEFFVERAGPFVETFESFYRREQPAVVGLAYVLSGSRAAADDLAQDAFLAAYRAWDRVGGYDKPEAWVRAVVAKRSASLWRRRTREAKAFLRAALHLERAAFPAIDPDSEVVWAAVRRLPRRQAQAIALHYLGELKVEEIAHILGCSESSVKTHLARGRERLADWLKEER